VAIDEDYILAMSQGTSWVAPEGTAAPTGMVAPSTPYKDLGAMSTDGLSENLAQSRTEFKRWGSISVFKTVITDQKHEFKVKFLETNVNVLSLFYRVATPTPDATSHIISITDDTTGKLDPRTFLFDVLEGTNHIRFYVPNGEVTNVDSPVYKLDGLVEYGVTITAYPDSNGIAVARTYLLDAVVAG
jgi:hypothetical protein